MATDLKDYIRCYDDLVPMDLCHQIINEFELERRKEVVDKKFRPKWTEFNVSKHFSEPSWQMIQTQVQKYFVDAVGLYIKDLDVGADFPSSYCFEEYRIKKYEKGSDDQFQDHVDVQDYQSARRFVSVMLYLNNAPVGGRTHFPRIDYEIEAKECRVAIFPANWMFRHAGRPTVESNKYIMGSYLHYL